MPSIADSNAVLYNERVLPQHHTALTLIKNELESPSRDKFKWLDLACGRGQILVKARDVLGAKLASKVDYTGVDVDQRFAREAESSANSLFGKSKMLICDLPDFDRLLDQSDEFDFITFTNTAHEISPRGLASTMVNALCRLRPNGHLFAYDMEQLIEPELGAISWQGYEVEKVFHGILRCGGELMYLPKVSVFPHRNCDCWCLHINGGHWSIPPGNFPVKRNEMLEAACNEIESLLHSKLLEIHGAIDDLCNFGVDNCEESNDTMRLLHQYWSISRALGLATRIPFVANSVVRIVETR